MFQRRAVLVLSLCCYIFVGIQQPLFVSGWVVPYCRNGRPSLAATTSRRTADGYANDDVHDDHHDSIGSSPSTSSSTSASLSNQRRSLFRSLGSVSIAALGLNTATAKSALGMYNDAKSGIAFPEVNELESMAIPRDWSEVENPLSTNPSSQLSRLDSTPDTVFYTDPRFVEHVDDNAVQLMTKYVSEVAIPGQNDGPDGIAVLDLCSSWTSHIDTESVVSKNNGKMPTRVAGLGMNAAELKANKALTEWTVQDLNTDPKLPYNDGSFDVVLCQLSIDYLTRPLEVMEEVSRVLRPGGKVHVLFSNRLFLSKVRTRANLWYFCVLLYQSDAH